MKLRKIAPKLVKIPSVRVTAVEEKIIISLALRVCHMCGTAFVPLPRWVKCPECGTPREEILRETRKIDRQVREYRKKHPLPGGTEE